MTSSEAIAGTIAAHERRLPALDPLLPAVHSLPQPEPADTLLEAEGAVGLSQLVRPDPDALEATWGAAEQHRLLARVAGSDPVAAMAGLLARWRERVAAQAEPAAADSEAATTWPSRDTAMTQLFLAYGLAPQSVIAVRPAGRPIRDGEPGRGVHVRPARPDDLDAGVELWLEVVRWDAQFSSLTERPSTTGQLRAELREVLARQDSWTLVGEVDGQVAGLLMISPPERSGWIAPVTSAAPAAYLGCLVVTAAHRGGGLGAALVREGHRALDAAGVAVTLLHYAALNPLSGPFWHGCGYRPLWTSWRVRPAARLGVTV